MAGIKMWVKMTVWFLRKVFKLHWRCSGNVLEAKMRKLVNFKGNIKDFLLSSNLFQHHFSSSRLVNLALSLNAESCQPVRVIRGYKLQSPFAPEYGYRYDGKQQTFIFCNSFI